MKNSLVEMGRFKSLELLSPEAFQKINLRDAGYDEKWLQDYLKDNSSALGLSKDLILVSGERAQPKGGRLDLLFEEIETEKRFCVEIMLGQLDPSHIIRTIEYWDNERSRPGAKEHVAVLVAEHVADHRYLGVISVIAKAVPIVVLQMNCFKIEDKLALSFSTILDHTEPLFYKNKDEDNSEGVTKAYWEEKSSDSAIKIADQLFDFTKSLNPKARQKYNKHHIAIGVGSNANFMWLNPRKAGFTFFRCWISPEKRDEAEKLFKKMDVEFKINNYDEFQTNVILDSITKHEEGWKKILLLAIESSS